MSNLRSMGHLLLAVCVVTACSSGSDATPGAAASGDAAAAGGTVASTRDGAAAPAGEGFRFTFTGSTRSEGGPPGASDAPGEMSTTVQVRGGKARIDVERGGAGMEQGTYILADAGAQTMRLVNPGEKKVLVMSDSAGGGPMAGMAAMAKLSVVDTSSRVEDLGAGETILGFATRKYRITRKYTMQMEIMGRKMPMRNESVATVHISTELGGMDTGFEAFSESFGKAMGGAPGGGAEVAATLRALEAGTPKGFPLLREEETRMATPTGGNTSTHSTWRMTAFSRGGVSADAFTVPDGYTVTDMATMMRNATKRR